jgi:UDP-N-acetylmuramyl pentapeptide synthase
MRELGRYSEEAHRAVGDKAAEIVDILICVGDKAKFIYNEALSKNFKKENLYFFETSIEAAKIMDALIQEGDLILIKGSQWARMERITKEIMAEPELAKEILVRQDKNWKA